MAYPVVSVIMPTSPPRLIPDVHAVLDPKIAAFAKYWRKGITGTSSTTDVVTACGIMLG